MKILLYYIIFIGAVLVLRFLAIRIPKSEAYRSSKLAKFQKDYKSSKIISKIDSKLAKFHKAVRGDAGVVMFSFGVILLICVPILYLLGFNDLIPLALSSGIICLIFVVIFRLLIKS